MTGSMYEVLLNATKKIFTDGALVTMGHCLTFGKLFEDIDNIARGLIKLGIKKGDSIAINLPNFAEAIVAFYAINKCGAVANIIHPLTPTADLVEKTLVTGAKYLFTQDIFLKDRVEALTKGGITPIVCRIGHYATKLKGAVMRLAMSKKRSFIKKSKNLILYERLLESGKTAKANNEKYPTVLEKDVAIVLHSGGTTGTPKSIELSNFALNNLATTLQEVIKRENSNDGLLMVLPLFHGFGLGVCMHTGLYLGFRLIMMESFNAKKAVALMKKYDVSVVAGVPSMYSKILKEDGFNGEWLANLRAMFCGGDKLPTKLKNEFDKRLRDNGADIELSEGYGLTEVVTVCTVNRKGENEENSVGSPLNNVKLSIKNLDTGDDMPTGETGEICVTGDTVMNGYYKDEQGTAATMKKDKNGVVWVHSGDLGYLDEKGKLFFIERAKRVIKISGINVFPAQIEAIVYEHDGVKHCAVKEYIEKDKNYIELFVVVKSGFTADDKLKKEILELCGEKLMKYSLPKRITYKDTLPLTTVGKVDYKKL